MIGQRLAHYKITSHLGSGGMGDVYQATDSKLGRSVAIKLLPDTFAKDVERAARFEREARVLASLNHPHIAAIYGLEESGDRKFLVMELAAGETLAERISRGPLPLEEALAVAKQLLLALEEAHEKGVTHRDLKPANVKIAPDGNVKVLDFGLAKAMELTEGNANLSNSPTLVSMATNVGVILGTAAYMSPEQAKGQAVDRRTDIFAFGSVLYEMLTGRQAFPGDTVGDILAAVIRAEPDLSRLPVETPTSIRRLLRRCLQKDRNRRLQYAADARIEIDEVGTEPEVAEVAPVVKQGKLGWIVAAVLLIGMLALSVPAIQRLRETPVADPELRTDIVTPATSDPISFAVSPDGRQLVFVAFGDSADTRPRLWLRPLDKVNAQPLAGTEGASFPFWSPDSRSIGFSDGTKLKRIDVAGGSAQTLTDATNRGGTWSPDGIILFARTIAGPLFRIPATGGEVAPATKIEEQQGHRFPQFLPDGRQFLFYALGSPDIAGIYLGSLDSPETKRLTAADAAGVYSSQGWLLFPRAGALLTQRLDLERQELIGEPATVADSVVFDSTSFASAVSVSADGLVAYRTGLDSRRQLKWFDRAGKALGEIGVPDENDLNSPRLSPDDRRVAVARRVQGNNDIWLLDGARATRFTFDAGRDRYPLWSPDGSRIVFDSVRNGPRDLFEKPSSGADTETPVVESAQNKLANDWSPDGRFILFYVQDPQTGIDLWMLPTEGDQKPYVFLKTGFDERWGVFSPDQRWVAYMWNESGRQEIYIRPFPGPGGQWQASTAGGMYPKWGAGGKELYYIAPDGTLVAATIAINGATIEPGAPKALFHTNIFGGGTDPTVGPQYDVSRDGRFLINTVLDAAASPITLLQNWKPPVN